MDDEVKRRTYTSPGRQAQSDATRARILDAAADLFVAQGYAGTSTRAVAAAAGVSEASVFANFGSKARLLTSVIVDRVTTGPDFPLSENVAFVPGMPVAEAASAFARIARRAHDRSWRLLTVGATAAQDDPELAEVMQRGAQRRLSDIRWFSAEILRVNGPDQVADAIWTLGSVDVYRHLIVERDWPAKHYERWLARMIQAAADEESAA